MYMHGDLTETVYMRQPPGFQNKEFPNHVCFLHKAIYGLKQASRAWFDKFSSFLLDFGFICSVKDPSLFIYRHNSVIIYLLLYVDDMILTGNDQSMVQKPLASLNTEFCMKDMGPLSYFLGIQVKCTPTGMFLNQEKYATDLLEAAGKLNCSPMQTPLPLQRSCSTSRWVHHWSDILQKLRREASVSYSDQTGSSVCCKPCV